MSDEQRNTGDTGLGFAAAGEPAAGPTLDEHTTEPNAGKPDRAGASPAEPGKWQMPKPKFQQSSGYLPQGYLKVVEAAAAAAAAPGSEDTTQEQAPFVPKATETPAAPDAIEIEPQPDISEQLVLEEVFDPASVEEVAVKKGSSIVLVVLGILGIILFVAAFIAVVYFLFGRPIDTQLG